MAGDWIKMRLDLPTHPKVVRILSAMRLVDVQIKTDKFRVIGGLHAVWSVFDTHSADGSLPGYTPELLDHVIGWEGFSTAMIAVDWLLFDGAETLTLPEHDEHNGQSGKRRAEDQKRKRDSRKDPENVRNVSGKSADKKGTREEKRREEKKEDQKQGAPSALPDWLPIDSWNGYLEMRARIKKVPTDRAVQLVLSALSAMRENGQDIAAVLDKSTMSNWTDVYPIRDERRNGARLGAEHRGRPGGHDDIYAANRAVVDQMMAEDQDNERVGQG